MHHTAVLAALHDYRMVQQAKGAGGRKYCKREQEEAERYRVGPFVSIGEHGTTLKYRPVYQALLERYQVTKSPDIHESLLP